LIIQFFNNSETKKIQTPRPHSIVAWGWKNGVIVLCWVNSPIFNVKKLTICSKKYYFYNIIVCCLILRKIWKVTCSKSKTLENVPVDVSWTRRSIARSHLISDSMWVKIRWIVLSIVLCSWKMTPAKSRSTWLRFT
jgi:hypothetical protein